MSITIYKGNSKSWILTVKDSTQSPIDITGYTLEFQVKGAVDDADPALISKSVGSGITILTQSGATLGQAQIDVIPADTANLETRVHYYDVVGVDGSSNRYHLIAPDKFEIRGVVNQSS